MPASQHRSPRFVPPGGSVDARQGVALWALLGLITLVGFLLRLEQMGQSLAGDEALTFISERGQSLGGLLDAMRDNDEQTPPLYYILAWIAARLGDLTVWLRVPSLVLGTATIPLVYVLGTRTVGRRAALVGAALMSVTPFAVFYGSEARAYATLMFFATLATLALLLALERRQARWWALYALASTAVLYSHYIGGFVVAAGAAWALWTQRERWLEVVIAQLAIALAFLPELLSPRTGGLDLHGGPLHLRWSSLTDLVGLFPGYPPGSGGGPEPSLATVPGTAALVLVGAGLGVALIAGVTGRHRRAERRPESGGSPTIVLLAVMSIATPIGVLVYSLTTHDLFVGRYFSASLPALLLVIAWLLTRSGSRTALLAVALVLVGVSLGTLRMLDPSNERPPYRDVARYIEENTGPGDHVIVPFRDPSQALFVGFLAQSLLEVYDVKSHPIFFQQLHAPPAWAPAGRARTVAVLVPDSAFFPRFPRYAGPRRCFVRSAQRTFEGRWHPQAAIYRVRRGQEACSDRG